MKVVIAKVDEVYFDGEADSLTAPGAEGEMTVMGGHMPLVTTLKAGALTIRAKNLTNGQQTFPVSGGVLEIRHEGVTVIL